MKRSGPIPKEARPRKLGPVPRDWTMARAKVNEEGRCRNCQQPQGMVRLEAAHTLGREYDEPFLCKRCDGTGEGQRVGTKCSACKGHGQTLYVDPELVIPLCGPATSTDTCHGLHHARKLDLLPILTGREQLAALAAIVTRAEAQMGGRNVGIAEAYRRLSGRAEPPPPPSTFEGGPAAEVPGQTSFNTYDIISGNT